jgi:hypothetical protein
MGQGQADPHDIGKSSIDSQTVFVTLHEVLALFYQQAQDNRFVVHEYKTR